MSIFNPEKTLIKTNNNSQEENSLGNINFYLLDYYQNIQNIKKIDITKDKSEDNFYLFVYKNDKIVQEIYNFKDFKKYYFILLVQKNQKDKKIGILLSKLKYKSCNQINIKFNVQTEIRWSPLIGEISKELKINLKNNFDLEEIGNYSYNKDKYFEAKLYIFQPQIQNKNNYKQNVNNNGIMDNNNTNNIWGKGNYDSNNNNINNINNYFTNNNNNFFPNQNQYNSNNVNNANNNNINILNYYSNNNSNNANNNNINILNYYSNNINNNNKLNYQNNFNSNNNNKNNNTFNNNWNNIRNNNNTQNNVNLNNNINNNNFNNNLNNNINNNNNYLNSNNFNNYKFNNNNNIENNSNSYYYQNQNQNNNCIINNGTQNYNINNNINNNMNNYQNNCLNQQQNSTNQQPNTTNQQPNFINQPPNSTNQPMNTINLPPNSLNQTPNPISQFPNSSNQQPNPTNQQLNSPNQPTNPINQPTNPTNPINPVNQINNIKYYFPKKGLYNIGSTCYMNATLQCLLHVSELVAYFINEYKNDYINLKRKNKDVETEGELSEAFYKLVKGVVEEENIMGTSSRSILNLNTNTTVKISSKKSSKKFGFNYTSLAFSPDDFKRTLGKHNSQFRRFEANDSKDLILYLLQTMHEELNYFGDAFPLYMRQPNQHNRALTFNYFMQMYNTRNFSIISNIFYGTYENETKCLKCNNVIYNFQKFEFISFGLYDYHKKKFNIEDGFKDNEKPQKLTRDNQFYCNDCQRLCDAIISCKIIQPPNKLLINLDYGKNKKYQPYRIEFDESIDITKFVNFDFGVNIRYNIIGVCTHLGSSGSWGHYIAYCRNRETGEWYKFNDSNCSRCNVREINGGSPYLLLYERI